MNPGEIYLPSINARAYSKAEIKTFAFKYNLLLLHRSQA